MTTPGRTLRSLPLFSRLALAGALAVGLFGLLVSAALALRTGAREPGTCLSPEATRLRVCAPPLERAMETSMARHIPDAGERETLRRWMAGGARMGGFYEGAGEILRLRCATCHGAQAGAQAGVRLETYGDALALATPEGRDPYRRLHKLHVHVFSIGAILALFAWALERTRFPRWLTAPVGVAPLVGLVASVPLTLWACQSVAGPVLIWAAEGLVLLGWVSSTVLVAWDLWAPPA